MKKHIYNFSLATLIFCAVMHIALAIYTGVTGVVIEEHGWLLTLDNTVNFMYLLSGAIYLVFLLKAVDRYMDTPTPRITLLHAKAEVNWSEIERDDDGEEIRRSRHSIQFCHTMNDQQLEDVIEVWHMYRKKYEKDARSSQDCVDFINCFTPHWAALTEEDLLNRLKQK